jgi:hypothetical protein
MRWVTIAIICLILFGCSTTITRPSVESAAVADTVSTAIVLDRGGRELNPLGFAGTSIVKGIYLFGIRHELDQETRLATDRTAGSLWSAAAVNNMAQLVSPGLFGYYVGLAVFFLLYLQ